MKNSPHSSKSEQKPGTLYVVATPIGNLEDITLRAIRILGEVDLIAAEDTRHTAKLLGCHDISAKLVSCHEHNERIRCAEFTEILKNGKNIALVSNAGTPSVSDPGYRLVRKCIQENIEVTPVPGVSSAVTAVCVSGLPTDSFVFVGFLPRKRGKRDKLLSDLSKQPRTLIFFESPRRVPNLLEDLIDKIGDRSAVLAREMTKIYEEFIRGRLSQIKKLTDGRGEIKGECTLLVEGLGREEPLSQEELRREIENAMEKPGEKLSSVVKKIADRYGVSRKWVYDEALELKKREV